MKLFTAFFICSIFVVQLSSQNIFRAACNGNIKRLDSMLLTTPIDIKDSFGQSLLHWAVACKQNAIFNILIKKEIALNTLNNKKKTPLHMAIKYSNEIAFDTLLKIVTRSKWTLYAGTLLEFAVLNENTEFITKLAENGADIDAKNDRGSTALEIALRNNSIIVSKHLIALGADPLKVRQIRPTGKYMGQTPPNLIPKLFAPNFISTEQEEFGSVFSSSGEEFYYAAHINGKSEIRVSKLINNQWTKPKILLQHKQYGYNDPFLSPDEQRLYFISNQTLNGKGEPKDIDIWYIERLKNTWSEPINAGSFINTKLDEYYISFTNDNTMYFSSNGHESSSNETNEHDIFYSKFIDNAFQKPIKLGLEINSRAYEADVFVAPDESYLIFCSTRNTGFGKGDLYISFKDDNERWQSAINMGNTINSNNYEYCPFVTKDGKYLFYTSNQDIFWISTEVFNLYRE